MIRNIGIWEMLKISKYGLLLALMTSASSGHASDMTPGEVDASNGAAPQNVSAVAESVVVAPQVNDVKTKWSVSAKHDLSGHLSALKEPYQLPGSEPNKKSVGLLELLTSEVCVKDEAASALWTKDQSTVDQDINYLLRNYKTLQFTHYDTWFYKAKDIKNKVVLHHLRSTINEVTIDKETCFLVDAVFETLKVLQQDLDKVQRPAAWQEPVVWRALPYEVKKQLALKIREERINGARLLSCYACLLNKQSKGVEQISGVAGLERNSFQILSDFLKAKEQRAVFKYKLVSSRTLAALSPSARQIQKPHSLYGREALSYLQAANNQAPAPLEAKAQKAGPASAEDITETEESAFDRMTILQKIDHLNWVEQDETKRKQHALNMYALYKDLGTLIRDDLLPQIDGRFTIKVQDGNGPLLDAKGIVRELLSYIEESERKWQARTDVNSIRYKLGLSETKLPNIMEAFAYYVGLLPQKAASNK